jgi:hypothetical protein
MAGNVKRIDEEIPSKDRIHGLQRSDEELQHTSESGVGEAAEEKRVSDHVDPSSGRREEPRAERSEEESPRRE